MSNNIAMADAFMAIFGMKRVDNMQICQTCFNGCPVEKTSLLVCKTNGEEKNAGDTCDLWAADGAT